MSPPHRAGLWLIPFWGSKWASLTNPAWQKNPVGSYLIIVVAIIAFTAVFGGLYMAVQSSVMRHSGGFAAEMTDKLIRYGAVALLFGGVGGWYWWSQRSGHGNLVIDVTGDGMTVSKRPGDVYRFADATLGVWGVTGGMTMGTALHLRCGPRRFILGGRDFRAAAGTRLDAPDAGYGLPVDIDAWVTGAEFGEILAMAGRRGNHSLAVRPPDPGSPPGACCFPAHCWSSRWGRSRCGENNNSCDRSINRAWPSTSTPKRCGWSTWTPTHWLSRRRWRR